MFRNSRFASFSNFSCLTKYNSAQNNRPQHEAPGNKLHNLCSYFLEPRAEVYCFVIIVSRYSIVIIVSRYLAAGKCF